MKKYETVWGYCECGVYGLAKIVDNGIGATEAWGVWDNDVQLDVESECCNGTMFYDEELTEEITVESIEKYGRH